MSEEAVVEAMDGEEEEGPERPSIMIVSDFVCPWCYLGLMEVEQLKKEYDFELQHVPYLLRPDTPPEGQRARHITHADAPPTPLEQRGEKLGIKFTRGRTWTPYSHYALEAGEFAFRTASEETAWSFHRRVLKAYFTDLEDIGDVEVLARLADETGVDSQQLREVVKSRELEKDVDEGIEWSRSVGVTAIPTFIFNGRMGMVGAQELPAFREMMQRVGNPPRA